MSYGRKLKTSISYLESSLQYPAPPTARIEVLNPQRCMSWDFLFANSHPSLGLTIYPQGVYGGSMIADIKKRASHRSKIIEGQFKGLQKAIENEEYCMDILTQSLAIQKSLASLNKLILENHLRTHVADMMSSPNSVQQEKAVEELLSLYELNNVRSKTT